MYPSAVVVLLCVVVCKRGGEVSLIRVQILADPVRVRSVGGIVVSIAAFKAVNLGSIPG
jgi:hypothetical protein